MLKLLQYMNGIKYPKWLKFVKLLNAILIGLIFSAVPLIIVISFTVSVFFKNIGQMGDIATFLAMFLGFRVMPFLVPFLILSILTQVFGFYFIKKTQQTENILNQESINKNDENSLEKANKSFFLKRATQVSLFSFLFSLIFKHIIIFSLGSGLRVNFFSSIMDSIASIFLVILLISVSFWITIKWNSN